MPEEILNIEYNIKLLVHKALNKRCDIKDAAIRLCISERTVYRYIEMWFIWNEFTKQWDRRDALKSFKHKHGNHSQVAQ